MCGIAGWLGPLENSQVHAERLAKALHHRGPDAHGIKVWPQATLVHTRLSVIDLSEAGSQPMSNEDGTVWTVFNGEIYNYGELRRMLQARGHIFRGHSDTEIIPHLYEEEGLGFVKKLRGMFAVAVYDIRNHTVVLARDRFGIKPLYYTLGHDRLAFASELNALLELPFVDRRPDRQAIYDFSAIFYIPAPETFYTGIRALQPGEMLQAELGHHEVSWKTQFYHHWTVNPDPEMTLTQAIERTDALIVEAVRRQLESDVPLGSLLSGGIDSSLVSAGAQKVLDQSLQTFSVRFPDKDFDETWAAVAVAEHIGSQHHILDMDEAGGTWANITGLLMHAGQPFADTSFFAVNAVSRAMRRHVTVALSGDGGDEGFGGYNLYWQIARIALLQRVPSFFWEPAAVALSPFAKLGLVPFTLPQRIRDLNGADDTTIVQNMFCWLRDAEHESLCRDKNLLPVRRLFEPSWEYLLPRSATRLERLSAHATEANIRLTLSGDFLFKVDMASMKESLEVRVPMLDEDLFSFGLSLPHHLKVEGRTCKKVLREVSKAHLPPAVANKPKMGFGIPVDKWVDTDFKGNLREALLGTSSRLEDFFEPKVYTPIVKAFCEGGTVPSVSREGLYQRVIMLLSVQLALENNVNSSIAL